MGSPVVVFCLLLLLPLTHSSPISTEFLRPNFTASNFRFIDHSGTFLSSPDAKFIAAITNTYPESPSFYFAVLHADSKTIIWSANRDSPISISGKLNLTLTGLYLADDAGKLVWSTTDFDSPVSLLQLQDNGNLVLLDSANQSLWESFDHPTDTIVAGQRLPVGKSLVGGLSETDLSGGDYRFTVAVNDAVLLWNGLVYWKLSMDLKANPVSNLEASYLELNNTGLYLLRESGSVIVIQLVLGSSSYSRFAKLESNGSFAVKSFEKGQEFEAPAEDCRIPSICGRIGLCSPGKCSCPPGFRSNSSMNGDCTPADDSFSLPPPYCSLNRSNSKISYMNLGNGMDYFSNHFTQPVIHGVSLSFCEDLCNNNCTCLGIFHDQSEGSCYLLENQLGSIMSNSDETDRIGYIKALLASSEANTNGEKKSHFPILGLVLLPLSGFLLVFSVVVIGAICYRNKKRSLAFRRKLGPRNSSASAELDIVIPGLPVRFHYDELVEATENFSLQIGSGGFGIVYKGTLKDKTFVAVKKITSLGVQGKREFCTEIAVIGNIHHVNLVRLKGYCAYGRQMFLVYEYMSRGSLDRILFGNGPVLEWQERYEIALATARGLAYLHSGCDHKIIHCDVKPENILLHDHMQVKISDFGLSKLLTPEQSGLFTTMRGTRGYLAPEWLSNSAITDKSDVYSYGMVLLEIVRGKKNSYSSSANASSGQSSSTSSSENSVYFPLFALEMHEQKRYLELADSRLGGFARVTSEEVEKLVRVALCCIQEEASRRPSMSNVVSMLEGGLPLGQPRVESLNFLRFLGRRFAEASAVGGGDRSQFAVHPLAIPTSHSSSSGGCQKYSHMSSQDVSGPR